MRQTFYELAIFGDAPAGLTELIQAELEGRLSELGLKLGDQVSLHVGPAAEFRAVGERCAAALCFTSSVNQNPDLIRLMKTGIAIIPVASAFNTFHKEFSAPISTLNGMSLDKTDAAGLVLALLECASLLPRQRRVFISYRRDESTEAALQLYAALSGRLFDVFLDTHDIHPGKHFQEVLWQRLCDCDVLLFLDTPKYFESRWTEAEFGRAEYRAIPLLRAAWPGVALHERAQFARTVQMEAEDFKGPPGHLTPDAVKRICDAVEDSRTTGVAARYLQLITTLRDSLQRGRGHLEGVSLRRSLIAVTPAGKRIAVYPSLGVPTSHTLHNATLDQHPSPVAVVYDEAGIDEKGWREHMDWISEYVQNDVRLVSSHKAGWDFADWK